MPKVKAIKRSGVKVFPACDYAEASSLKALHAGTATSVQQQIALKWILYNAAICKSLAFDPDNARVTDFNSGRQFVAHAIVYAIEEPISTFPKQNP